MDNSTFTTFEQMLMHGDDSIAGNDTSDSRGNPSNGNTNHLGVLTATMQSEDHDSAEDVVANLLKEHRRQHGEDDDDEDDCDGDDLHDVVDDETRQHQEQHRALVQQLVSSTSSVVDENILMKQQDDDLTSVVNRQLSESFGDGPDYETTHQSLNSIHHHDGSNTSGRAMHGDSNNGVNIQLHQGDEDEEDYNELGNPPRICRICHKMDDRPVLRFVPVEYDMNVVAAAPHVQTFPLDICLHVFCGKTASILPSINQPEYEILTKAGIKNKHGIGGEVNAALSRTRCAILPNEACNGKEKQFYLVREFEAHLSAVRGYIQTNQQHQQQMLLHQNHYNPSASISSAHHQQQRNNTTIIHPSKNSPYIQTTQPHQATAVSSSASQIITSISSPTNGNNHQYSQLLQNLNGNGSNHSINSNNNLINGGLNGNGVLLSTPTGQSSQQPLQTQQQPALSSLLLNFNGDVNTNDLNNLYSSVNNGNDLLNINNNNNGSPTLEQLESMLRQQQQIQMQQQSSASSTSFLSNNNNSNNASNTYAPSVTNNIKKTVPIKAGNTNSKYQHGPTTSSTTGTDFKVLCACGGTHLSTHTTKGVSSYRNHIATKRHQKFINDQEQARIQQFMSGAFNNNANMFNSTNNHNNNLLYTTTPHPLYTSSSSTTSISMGQQQNQLNVSNILDGNSMNEMNNSSNHSNHIIDNGGSSSNNSSVYGAAV